MVTDPVLYLLFDERLSLIQGIQSEREHSVRVTVENKRKSKGSGKEVQCQIIIGIYIYT